MYDLKQSTAITIPFFAHDANGDGVTGIADGSWTKRISKNGAAFGAMTVTISEMENGWYSIPLSTSHTDTLGALSVSLSASGAKRVNLQWPVRALIAGDAVTVGTNNDKTGYSIGSGGITSSSFASSAINAAAIASDAITAAKIADGAIDAATFAAGAIDAAAIASDAISSAEFAQAAADKVWSSTTRTVTGFTTAAKAEIQTEAEDALVTHRLDELLNADSDIDGAAPPVVGSVFHELLSKTAGSFTFDQTTDSLEAIRDRGDAAWADSGAPPSAAVVADAVWDEARADHTAAGSFGQGAASVQGNVTGNVNGNVVGSVGSVTGNVGGNLVGTIGDLASGAKASVNAEVVDVIKVDTVADRGVATPPTTPTIEQLLSYVYLGAVGKKVLDANTGKKKVYNKAGTLIAEGNATDAGGVATVEALA